MHDAYRAMEIHRDIAYHEKRGGSFGRSAKRISLSLSLSLSRRAKFLLREATSFPAPRKRHKVFPIDQPELIDFLQSFPPAELFLFLFSPLIMPFESYRDRKSFPHRYLQTRADSCRRSRSPFAISKIDSHPWPEEERGRERKRERDSKCRRKLPFCSFVRMAPCLSPLDPVPCAPLC